MDSSPHAADINAFLVVKVSKLCVFFFHKFAGHSMVNTINGDNPIQMIKLRISMGLPNDSWKINFIKSVVSIWKRIHGQEGS